MAFGVALLANSRLSFVGAAIGVGEMTPLRSISWAIFFIFTGTVLFYAQSKDNR